MSASFRKQQRLDQGRFLSDRFPMDCGYGNVPYRLAPASRLSNLAPSIASAADAYFRELGIAWHQHANHGLSSQVCCLNFLMPLAQDPEALAKLIGRAMGISVPEMLPMERDASGRDWYVAFEWIGHADYLNEAGKGGTRTRGANATSSDAAVRYRHEGRTEIALIEWKYTENYGAPTGARGNQTRIDRYKDLAFAPAGPIRNDLGLSLEDFFWEPFYQLLRQQMLASRMEQARELDADRVSVLHISPAGNGDLHKVTAPALRRFGDDAFDAFKAVLRQPYRFRGWTIGDLFGPLIENNDCDWASYLGARYATILGSHAA
jgi:hypothetical protein